MNKPWMSTIIFDQYWQGVEWASGQHFADQTSLEYQCDMIAEPHKNVCEALSLMYTAFYPEEIHKSVAEAEEHIKQNLTNTTVAKPIEEGFLPWIFHQALYNVKNSDHTLLPDNRYKEVLSEILKREWLLSWHWRAVLPVLNKVNLKSKSTKFIIQISHIRKWEILLCYSVETNVFDKYNRVTEIPLENKTLLRAPIFGISHRLKGWDTYRLFYQEGVKEYVDSQLNDKQECTNRKGKSYILGRHDCYYIVRNVTFNKKNNRYTWEMDTIIEIEPEKTLIDKDDLGPDSYYYGPPDMIDIPSFGKHEGIPQLLASDGYCEGIFELTEVLNDPTAKSVLVIAPPGSGKEKLAQFAYFCRDRQEKKCVFISTTLAGLDATEAARLLFTFTEKDVDLKKYKIKNTDGLVFQALGGALFIDEIDKTKKDTRELLLRLLESGEITLPNSPKVLTIPKDMRPLYIFSGSMSRQLMFQESPPDFWSRISHVIEVTHPFGTDDTDKSRQVAKDYLWMFWCEHVKNFMKKKGVKKEARRSLGSPLNDYYLSLYKLLLDIETIDFATGILADEVTGRGKRQVSIRTLRSIVARSIFKFIDVLAYSKTDLEPIEAYKHAKKNTLKDKSCQDWFELIKSLFILENRRKHSEGQQIIALDLSVIDSLRSAIRLGAAIAQQ